MTDLYFASFVIESGLIAVLTNAFNRMKIKVPSKPTITEFTDVNGRINSIKPSKKMTLLAFFRDVNCPFCNLRIFELTQQYKELNDLGLEVIAVFSASEIEVRNFISKRERPFPVVADEFSKAHDSFGLERNKMAKYTSMMRHMWRLMKGFKLIGFRALKSDSTILPADFIIDKNGLIIDCYYGKTYADRMSLEEIKQLLSD